MSSDTQVIAVGNLKGGVGKTTNTVHLAAALGQRGKRCLIWDLDMNHGATLHLGVQPDTFEGAFLVLTGQRTALETIVTEEEPDIRLPKNVHLIPASRELERLEAVLAARDRSCDVRRILVKPLSTLRGKYDYIFLDTAPTATVSTIASYIAADWFCLSVTPESLALNGMRESLKDLRSVRQPELNPGLRLLGIVVSGIDRRVALARQYTAEIHEAFKVEGSASRMFETTISRAAAIPGVQKLGRTLFQTDPSHKVARQYLSLAAEVEARIAAFAKGSAPKTVQEVQNG